MPEPGVGTVSPLLDIAQLLSKVYIYFHPSHVRRQISPHPHHLLALLDYNFRHVWNRISLFWFEFASAWLLLIRTGEIKHLFVSLLTIQASTLWIGCSYLLFFCLVVYLFSCLFCVLSVFIVYQKIFGCHYLLLVNVFLFMVSCIIYRYLILV